MVTAGQSGQTGLLWLPAPGVAADCMDTNPAGNYYSLYCRIVSASLNWEQFCGNYWRIKMLNHIPFENCINVLRPDQYEIKM